MGEQLRMFRLTPGEVEIKARQIVDCQRRLASLHEDLKKAQEAMRESDEADTVKEIKDDIKTTRETAAKLVADLDGELIPGTTVED